MAHSPLKMFKQFHNKRVLVSGQGPIHEISKNLGFTNVCTVDDIRKAFPVLDVVDQRRRDNMVNTHLTIPSLIEIIIPFNRSNSREH